MASGDVGVAAWPKVGSAGANNTALGFGKNHNARSKRALVLWTIADTLQNSTWQILLLLTSLDRLIQRVWCFGLLLCNASMKHI